MISICVFDKFALLKIVTWKIDKDPPNYVGNWIYDDYIEHVFQSFFKHVFLVSILN